MAEEVILRREFAAELQPIGDGRTLDVRVMPYDVEADVRDGDGPVYRETWAPQVFDGQKNATHRVLVNVEHEQGFGGVVGRAAAFNDTPDSLHAEVRILSGPDGDKALELVNEGVLTGISVEAIPMRSERLPNGVMRRVKARLHNISLCRYPAFAEAQVLAVREQPLPVEEVPEHSDVDEMLERIGFESLAKRAVVRRPWNGAAAKYEDTAAYCKACLIDDNPAGEEKTQARCHLPVYEPNGDLNANALSSAAARLNQTKSPQKAAAARKLVRLYRQANMEPPPALRQMASR